MSHELPTRFVQYVPTGHRLWFSPKHDPELANPAAQRNANALGGLNRRHWILCVCGGGLRLEPSQEGATPSEWEWLDAVNQCRMSVHSIRMPCPPVNMDGVEQVVRDVPPGVSAPVAPPAPPVVAAAAPTRPVGRPRKEPVGAKG